MAGAACSGYCIGQPGAQFRPRLVMSGGKLQEQGRPAELDHKNSLTALLMPRNDRARPPIRKRKTGELSRNSSFSGVPMFAEIEPPSSSSWRS